MRYACEVNFCRVLSEQRFGSLWYALLSYLVESLVNRIMRLGARTSLSRSLAKSNEAIDLTLTLTSRYRDSGFHGGELLIAVPLSHRLKSCTAAIPYHSIDWKCQLDMGVKYLMWLRSDS